MGVTLVTDSTCDLPREVCAARGIEVVPMRVRFGEKEYLDGVDLTNEEFALRLAAAAELPQTAQPSPQAFLEAFGRADGDVLCITVSSGLSGTYQTARLAADMAGEGGRKVGVIDSHTASIGLGVLVLEAAEQIAAGLSLPALLDTLLAYRDKMRTMVVLDTLENVVKGGRLTRFEGLMGNLLNIKPVMMGDPEGKLVVAEKARGQQKALRRALDILGEAGRDLKDRIVGISHLACLDEALALKDQVVARFAPREVVVAPMGATIGTYAGRGGIIIAG